MYNSQSVTLKCFLILAHVLEGHLDNSVDQIQHLSHSLACHIPSTRPLAGPPALQLLELF